MPRDQSVPELVQDDACKERDNKTYSAQDCLQAPSFQPVKDNHPQNQQKKGRVNVEIDTRKPSDSPRPAHPPYLIAKARKRGGRTATPARRVATSSMIGRRPCSSVGRALARSAFAM